MRFPLSALVAAAVLLFLAAAAIPVAAWVEFRLQSSTATYGALLFRTTATGSWKSVAYTGFPTATADLEGFCRMLGFSQFATTPSLSSTTASTAYPIGMYSVSCTTLPTNPAPGAFDSHCSSSTSGTSTYRVYLRCGSSSGSLRDGNNIGFPDGAGEFYFRFNNIHGQLQFRKAQSAQYSSICADDTTMSESRNYISNVIGRWTTFDSGAFDSMTRLSSMPAYGMSGLKCTSTSYVGLSESDYCTYQLSSSSCSANKVVTFAPRDSYYGARVGNYFIKLASRYYGSLYIRPAMTGTWGVSCKSSGAESTSLTSTTMNKLCRWMSQSYGAAYERKTTSYSTTLYWNMLSSLSCGSSAATLTNASTTYGCSWSDHSSKLSSGSISDSSCTLSNAVSIYCKKPYSSSSYDNDVGIIIPAVVGGVFGCIFLSAMVAAICASSGACDDDDSQPSVVTLGATTPVAQTNSAAETEVNASNNNSFEMSGTNSNSNTGWNPQPAFASGYPGGPAMGGYPPQPVMGQPVGDGGQTTFGGGPAGGSPGWGAAPPPPVQSVGSSDPNMATSDAPPHTSFGVVNFGPPSGY